jgi:hypothetical protein
MVFNKYISYIPKTSYTVIFLVLILSVLFYISTNYKESFLDTSGITEGRCATFSNCKACSEASGCSWCSKAKICLRSTSLKATDKECNQMNTISSSFRCKSILDGEIPPPDVKADDEQYDFTLYKDKIADRIPPPNIYTTGEIKYSNADVVSNMNDVRNHVNNLSLGLPGIISSSVENEIKPMVKGILRDNYYIQGFVNYSQTKDKQQKIQCSKRQTCMDCTDSPICGWDPLRLKCDERSPNKTQYITQKPRCVTTPATLNLMRTSPN